MKNNNLINKLIILISVLASLTSYAQRDAIEFDRISIENGLSQSTVYCILQDHNGFMWFGTEDGLNRYDGYTFKIFKYNPKQEGSITNNRIIALIEDKDNSIWIGTVGGGLVKFDRQTETFKSYKHDPENPNSLSHNRVMALCEDPSGKIWIGTADGGLNLLDPKTENFTVYKNSIENPKVLPDNIIRSLFIDSAHTLYVGTNNGFCSYDAKHDLFKSIDVYTNEGKKYPVGVVRRFLEDKEGNLWIATDEHGLIKFERENDAFTIFHSNQKKSGLASNTIHDIYQDEEGIIWIASYGGLQKYNPKSDQFYTYLHSIADPRSISSNLIRSIYEDKTGVLWIGTFNNGINKFDRKHRKFTIYRNQPGNPLSLPSSIIRVIFEDVNGNIWIGTYGEGLVKFDLNSEGFTHFKHISYDENSLPSNYITSIVEDQNQKLWIASNNGLSKYNPLSRSFKTFYHNPKDFNSLPDNRLRNLYVDKNNILWIATLNDGLCKLDFESNKLTVYKSSFNNPEITLSQDRVTVMYEDKRNNFWVGTSGEGLNLFNRETGFVRHFKYDSNDSTTISSNRIHCLYHDTSDRFWIGTAGGVNLFNFEDETFTVLNSNDGLPNDVIYGILEDGNGKLWFSTNNGLSRFDPDSEERNKIRNFFKSDGLQNNEFTEGAYHKTKSGLLIFGGISNFNVIDPENIKDNPSYPDVYITEIRIISRNTKDGVQKERVVNILEREFIELHYTENNISVYFTALHYSSPPKNCYKYQLEGFESAWIEPRENQRFATYTNLKPGKYTFKVIASNPDGIWNNKGDAFVIKIKSPFWYTWWFYIIAVIFIGGLLVGIAILREANLIKKRNELEEMVQIRTSEIRKQNEEIQQQAESLRQANEEIVATSDVLSAQNKELHEKNEEILSQRNELENQRNSLANLAWELQEKNEEIEKQKDLLAYQKKEITDSIMYAQRIQQAVLPKQEQIKNLFPEFFIFNRPKSIVGGDFYWATRIENYKAIAVVDCTGHGVPGGFMSMLGVLMLNEVISQRGILDPSKILNILRQNIISVLHQTGDYTDTGDGMDLSLCIINENDLTLQYSGANSSMLILQENEEGELVMLDLYSDRMPISYHLLMKSFTNQALSLKRNSILYMFSDGLIDQFGGEQGKKFQLSRLKNFINENKNLPLESQGIALELLFDKWKGNTYQVDDVLVMGLKV